MKTVKFPQQIEKIKEKYTLSLKISTVIETDGKKYKITRRFAGEKNLNSIMYGLAVNAAIREAQNQPFNC